MSKKHTEAKPDADPDEDGMPVIPPADPTAPVPDSRIVQPMIDELVAQSPPELPIEDKTPPPRGPLHPPQPSEHHRHDDPGDSGSI